MVKAYGGIVVDANGRILLREPTDHYDYYVWTFAKGGPVGRETAEETALREVREETGWTCTIVNRIPGTFAGGTTDNEYFLMRPVSQRAPTGETASIAWCEPTEARRRLALTTNTKGRERDLQVLEAALTLSRGLPNTD